MPSASNGPIWPFVWGSFWDLNPPTTLQSTLQRLNMTTCDRLRRHKFQMVRYSWGGLSIGARHLSGEDRQIWSMVPDTPERQVSYRAMGSKCWKLCAAPTSTKDTVLLATSGQGTKAQMEMQGLPTL